MRVGFRSRGEDCRTYSAPPQRVQIVRTSNQISVRIILSDNASAQNVVESAGKLLILMRAVEFSRVKKIDPTPCAMNSSDRLSVIPDDLPPAYRNTIDIGL